MSTVKKNVIHIGAAGNLGPAILNALKENPNFNVTVLSRKDSKSTPSGVKVVTADYSSHEDLVSAFKGQDTVVSTVGAPGLAGQIKLIDAAIEAGVKHFIPSEFGGNISNEKTQTLAVFGQKIKTHNYLQEKASKGEINYTSINGGPFFDWGLKVGFLGFNISEKKATLYDGGSLPFSTTTLASIGAAVAAAVSKPDEFKNRSVYIQSTVTTQRELLALFEKHTGVKWAIEEKSTADVEKEVNAKLAKGDYSTIWQLIYRSVWGYGYGGKFEDVKNEELGIKELSEQEIEELIKGLL
ncbi:hypothetical protein DFP73DRAFT_506296 [Morchella snyderi]|nr:hypothetical protein DFP73DRAFT_506296 [Morchella snyderi]